MGRISVLDSLQKVIDTLKKSKKPLNMAQVSDRSDVTYPSTKRYIEFLEHNQIVTTNKGKKRFDKKEINVEWSRS